VPNLAKLSASELADALDSPNGWQRDTAQRLLLERGDKSVAQRIENLARNAKSEKVRVQALWTLNGLNVLSDRAVCDGLKDESAAVREHAVRLSELALSRTAVGDEIAKRVLLLANDSNPRIRYQVAFTLGEWNDQRAAETLVTLLRDADENIRNASLSSAPRHAQAMLRIIERLPHDDPARAALAMLKKLETNPPAFARSATIIEHTDGVSAAHRAEREKVVQRYAVVSTLEGNAAAGAPLFKQHCAQCHRVGSEGIEIGPDLGTVSGKSMEQLVQAILDPNAAIEARYQSFTVTAKADEEISGVIIAETPNTVTLRAVNGGDRTFLRSEITEISNSRFSLMPDGFETAMTPQQLADLIAFVTGGN
jgi:putative heme-binding domain-containing protein